MSKSSESKLRKSCSSANLSWEVGWCTRLVHFVADKAATVMKFYGRTTSNVQRAILPLFEAEVDVEKELELVEVDILFSQDQHNPIYLAKQPFGQIPYFEDGDIALFESRAIAKYIAEKYRNQGTPLLGKTLQEEAIIDQWVECEAHNLYPVAQPMVLEILMSRGMKRPTNEKLVAECKAKLQALLGVYEAHLAKGETKYLVGEAYTLADACHAPYVEQIWELTPDVVMGLPRVAAWMERIVTRPAVRQCMTMDWSRAKPLQ